MPTITREELYAAVWTTPLTKLASQFGVSDVAVAKACRKRAIPLPGLGHWAKVAAGHSVPRPSLPPKDPGRGPVTFKNVSEVRAQVAQLTNRVVKASGLEGIDVRVPERLVSPHPLTVLTRRKVETVRRDDKGYVQCWPPDGYDMAVSRSQVSRALRLLDTLVRELEARGANVALTGERRTMFALISAEQVRFSLRETYTQTKKEPVEAERARGLLGDISRQTYVPTSKLQIRIDAYTSPQVPRTWSDGRKPLEERLGEVVSGFFVAGEALHQRTLYWERWREEREEVERRQREEEERQAREQHELETLIQEADLWGDANAVRRYLRALREALEKAPGRLSEEGRVWLEASEARAERMNPFARRLSGLIVPNTEPPGTT